MNVNASLLHHPIPTIKQWGLHANDLEWHLASAHYGVGGVFGNEHHIPSLNCKGFVAQAHGAFACEHHDLFAVGEVAMRLHLCADDDAKGGGEAVATQLTHIHLGSRLAANGVGVEYLGLGVAHAQDKH